LRVVGLILGIIIAAAGGVILYRALFVHPGDAFVVTSTGNVKEVGNWWRAAGGGLMLLIGTGAAILSARRRS
jgi:hypothetical protein